MFSRPASYWRIASTPARIEGMVPPILGRINLGEGVTVYVCGPVAVARMRVEG